MRCLAGILAIGISLSLSGFDDIDSAAAEYPTGLVANSNLFQAFNLVAAERDDGRQIMPGFYNFRDGAHVCGEYHTRGRNEDRWQRHWYLVRFDDLEHVNEENGLFPMSLENSDATPVEVAEWCPRLASSGDFSELMTAQNWSLPAKHLLSVRHSLNEHLDSALANAFGSSGWAPIRSGTPIIFPESATRICGTVPLRLQSDHVSHHPVGFTARISAERMAPDSNEPFPLWNVQIEDLRLISDLDEAFGWCPSLALDEPEGYGALGQLDVVSPADALEAHQNDVTHCRITRAENPYFPDDRFDGICRQQGAIN